MIMHMASPKIKSLSSVVATSVNGMHRTESIMSLAARFRRNKFVIVLIFFSLIIVKITRIFPVIDITKIILYSVILNSVGNWVKPPPLP
jgi:hypothetical protein